MIEVLRSANILLGAMAFFMLCYRTPTIAQRLASKRLYFSLAAFPILVCFGSVWALAKNPAPSPTLPLFTVAYLSLNVVLVWLPHRLRR